MGFFVGIAMKSSFVSVSSLKANPLATIWSASQLLDFLGYTDWGKVIIDCIEEVLCEKKVLTADLGGNNSTSEVGDEILKKIKGKRL